MRLISRKRLGVLAATATIATGLVMSGGAVNAASISEIELAAPTRMFTVPHGSPQEIAGAEFTAGSTYANADSFTGFAVSNGGAALVGANLTTVLLCDDTTNIGGGPISQVTWSVSNLNAAAVTARMRLRFFDDDGAGGGPGTLLGAFSFAATSLPTGVSLFSFNPLAGQLTLPSGLVWCGEFFDNSGAAATTAAQLNNLGQGTFDPPAVGSSADLDFLSSVPPPGVLGNPAGAQRPSPFSGNPVASYGWELVLVPEPGSLMLVGAGMLALVRRRIR